jgi:hydroxyacylglutathione hydrolase
MYIEQLYTSCLSEAAYFVESQGEAIIIDPLRDIDVYLQLAKDKNATIKYIFETHFHADFVSGHLDLSAKTNAPIVYGPNADTKFEALHATDEQIFKVGGCTIKVLHTPGHTMESTCYLLSDENGKEHCIFTGDTLFIGDVGRPDLSQQGEISKEELAATLFLSLRGKIMPLADDIIVYPAHGAGSSCGKNLSKETSSTIGQQKQTNYALQSLTVEEFVAAVTDGLSAPPVYFPINAKINKDGYDSIDAVLATALQPITATELNKMLLEDAEMVILDTRKATIFTQGFVPTSIFVGLEGRFAEWAGNVLPFNKPIVLVTEIGDEKETAIRLSRVGLDNAIGYLDGGFEAWIKEGFKTDMIIDIEADELAMDIKYDEKMVVLDVRNETEFGSEHIVGAENFPLQNINDPLAMALVNDDEHYYAHCAGGYRSVIAISILKKHGFHNVRNILGGFNAIKLQDDISFEKEEAIVN